ncbi:NADP-dependent oxidoreductase [Dactylosporangium sucinum]
MASMVLRSRPTGLPTPENFDLVEGDLPRVVPGAALVENRYLSVDPYMRQLMDDGWALGEPFEGRSVGRVLESADPRLAVGDVVFHRGGWRTHALVDANDPQVRVLPEMDGVSLSMHLGILGGTGLTAYVGLVKIARLEQGETVFISAAAGGVGTAAGQLARMLGAGRVIGSTGSAAKARYLVEELGFDEAFNYRDAPVVDQLRAAAPDGIHVYLDNVGGDHLEAAIGSLVDHGRIAWCGAIAQYQTDSPPAAPRNLYDIAGKSLRLEGYLVREYGYLQQEWTDLVVPRLRSGQFVATETIIEGFDHIVDAFVGLLRGDNVGKMIVSVEPS